MRAECKAEFDRGFAFLERVNENIVQKIKDDAKSGKFYNANNNYKGDAENSVLPADTKISRVYAVELRRPHIGHQNPLPTNDHATLSELSTNIKGPSQNGYGTFIPQGKVRIEVVSTHRGHQRHDASPMVYLVEPPKHNAKGRRCKIGRSTGLDFKQNGVCLQYDEELSTKHGQLTQMNKKYYYEDTHSSNGTIVVSSGERLEPGVVFPLEDGMVLQMGQSQFQFNFSPL